MSSQTAVSDGFALHFLEWMTDNYVPIGNGLYFENKIDLRVVDRPEMTAAECLKKFKGLPASPSVEQNSNTETLEEALRVNWILMHTLNGILNLLFRDNSSSISKSAVQFIVGEGLNTINKISDSSPSNG